MKTYVGTLAADGDFGNVIVYDRKARKKRKLRPRLDLANHSPTGFAWGYGGSGPAQLSLAILADHLRNDELALKLHQDFKWALISKFEQRQGWSITTNEINAIVRPMLLRRWQQAITQATQEQGLVDAILHEWPKET